MNIFVSDSDPVISARNLDDKRVKHMPKECFEMLSMAYFKRTNLCIAPFIIWDVEPRGQNREKFNELLYHKCTNWVASKRENFVWLWNHAIALLNEHEYRTGHTHYLYSLFTSLIQYIPDCNILPKSFVKATSFGDDNNVFNAYKEALNYKWFVTDEIKPVVWTKRGKPSWARQPIYITQGDLFINNDIEENLPF